MKILFVMMHPGYMRYYATTLRALAERGHRIALAFENPQKQSRDLLHEKLAAEFPTVKVLKAPIRKDRWVPLLKTTNWGMDYLRYFTPKYRNTPRLRLRVEAAIPPALERWVRRLARLSGRPGIALGTRLLKAIFRGVPAEKEFVEFIAGEAPDAVLVTPLITQGSFQGEFLRAARRLGIPTAYCVASWDNLSSKGLVRGDPDRVILWNESQKEEAAALHAVPPSRVIVTGAQNFDDWFERKPSRSREEFCRKIGLRPDRPFLLYLCSSNFMAPNEAGFVKRWLEAIRSSARPAIAELGVLIRPYPEHAAPFNDFDLGQFPNVAIHPRGGGYPLEEEARADFFNAIHHAAAVVGVNTSAMIESVIIGRSVLTLLAEEFHESQEGTIHFQYLRSENGGFLHVGSSLEEHLRQLEQVIGGGDAERRRIEEFKERFVRPRGLDKPCIPVVVTAIEQLASLAPRRRPGAAAAAVLARPIMVLLARLSASLWTSDSFRARSEEWKAASRAAEKVGGDPLKIWQQMEESRRSEVGSRK